MQLFKDALRVLWKDTCTVYTKAYTKDPQTGLSAASEVPVFTDVKCKLSIESTPPVDQGEAAAVSQRIRLFIGEEVPAGSKVVVTRGNHEYTYCCSSAPVFYPIGECYQLDLTEWEGWA